MAPRPAEEQEEASYEDEDDMEPSAQAVNNETLFSCRIDSSKVVTSTLICLSNGTKKDQLAQVEVNEEGIVFIVTGRAKFTQAQGTINSNLFQAFQCQPEGGRFIIDLPLLLECLQVFGTSNLANTQLTMSYQPARAVLQMTLEEQGVLTTCEINAMEEGEDALDLAALATAFRGTPEVFRAILKSEVLKEAISDLSDLPGATTVRVRVSPHEPHFHLIAGGYHGSLEIFLPRTSEVRMKQIDGYKPMFAFIHFDCTENHQWAYTLSALNQGMRALAVAKETYVRINEEGIMCVQHQVENPGGGQSFIDFLMCADEEEDEQEEGGGGGGGGGEEREGGEGVE